MRISIEDRNQDGRGRGYVGRRVALVSQAHPGEVVVMRVDRTTRGTVQGRVGRVLRADPRRIDHGCAHEWHCTGCPLLAVDPADEAVFKREALLSALVPLGPGVLEVVQPLVTPTAPFRYRHFAKQIFGRRGDRLVLGSYVAGTHRVVDNSGCPVLVPALSRVLEEIVALARDHALPLHGEGDAGGLRHVLARTSRATGETLVVIATSESPPRLAAELCSEVVASIPSVVGAHVLINRADGNVLLAGELMPVAGVRVLEEEMLGYRHAVGPLSFFQINPAAAEVIFTLTLEAAGTGASCVEAYAGVGALTLPLSDRFRSVVAIEAAPSSCASLRAIAASYPERTIEVVEGEAVAMLESVLVASRPDVVVLDPPRAGAGRRVMEVVAASGARGVVLVSCSAKALKDDLIPLLDSGWRVQRIHPVDQFPRTAHLETVTLLWR